MKISDELAAAEVLDLEGRARPLASLWAERPVLILWVRHFGCTFCRAQVAGLRPHVKTLHDAGVGFAIIGSGGPHFARAFVEDFQLDFPVYADEALRTYAAAGMTRKILHPMSLIKGVASFFKQPQKRTMGDPFQNGGAMVVKPDGTVTWSYLSKYAGDHPPDQTLLGEALKAAS